MPLILLYQSLRMIWEKSRINTHFNIPHRTHENCCKFFFALHVILYGSRSKNYNVKFIVYWQHLARDHTWSSAMIGSCSTIHIPKYMSSCALLEGKKKDNSKVNSTNLEKKSLAKSLSGMQFKHTIRKGQHAIVFSIDERWTRTMYFISKRKLSLNLIGRNQRWFWSHRYKIFLLR